MKGPDSARVWDSALSSVSREMHRFRSRYRIGLSYPERCNPRPPPRPTRLPTFRLGGRVSVAHLPAEDYLGSPKKLVRLLEYLDRGVLVGITLYTSGCASPPSDVVAIQVPHADLISVWGAEDPLLESISIALPKTEETGSGSLDHWPRQCPDV